VEEAFRSGYVSLVGRPNVGKSTLLNVLLGQKVSIITDKPQTTRNRILGIMTRSNFQIIFIDTPGIHEPKHSLGRAMVETASRFLKEIDLVLFMTDPVHSTEQDRVVLELLKKIGSAVMLVINKVDKIKKTELLSVIDEYNKLFDFKEIVPVSALKGEGIDILLEAIIKYIPEGPKYYPDDMVTDSIERFIAAEIIREKIIERTSDEVPHSVAVDIQDWAERSDGLVSISANIYVEREGQKGIIIGNKGRMIKMIGTSARLEIEKMLGIKVFLELWVKVKRGWRDDKKILSELGYL
jgi:GTP-binding protein Era